MAFYAEMVRRDSWTVNSVNRIFGYKKLLYEEYLVEKERKEKEYKEWYESLSDEERADVDRGIRVREEAERRESMKAINNLLTISSAMFDIAARSRGMQRHYNPYM